MKLCYSRLLVSAVVLVVLVSVVVALAGCGGKGGAGGAAMPKMLPKDVGGFIVADFATLRGDKDLKPAYNECKDQITPYLDALGISTNDVSQVGASEDGEKWILEGSFNLGDVRTKLKDNGYDDDEYKGVETWEGNLSVALVSGSRIVVGTDLDTVHNCIDVIKGDHRSLYDDNQDIRDVMGKLPSGIIYGVSLSDRPGIVLVGYSVVKKNSDTIHITSVYLCEDADSASGNESGIRNDMKAEKSYNDVEVTGDGKYVTATADQNIEDVSL